MSVPGRKIIYPTYRGIDGRALAAGGAQTHAQMIARGQVSGSKFQHITGRRLGVSTLAEAWPGTNAAPFRPVLTSVAALPSVATGMQVSSTDAADTAAGTGARVVLIEYIDENGWERMASAVLDGVTPVVPIQVRAVGEGNDTTLVPTGSSVSAVRVGRCYLLAAGSGGTNAGVISVYLGAPAPTTEASAMAIGTGISAQSGLTVPRGRVAIIDGMGFGSDRTEAGRVHVRTKALGLPLLTWVTLELGGSGPLPAPIRAPIRVAALGQFVLAFEKDGGGANIDVSSILQPEYEVDTSDPDPNPELWPMALG